MRVSHFTYGQVMQYIITYATDMYSLLFVCFLGVTTHCGCISHSPVAGFSLLVFEVT
jgi:hypothetical protein